MTFLRRPGFGARTPKQRAGDAAEQAACEHLRANGCTIVARNARYKEGELDIVARQGALLLFVEVRQRGSDRFGGAGASVDHFKRKRLLRASTLNDLRCRKCRCFLTEFTPRHESFVRRGVTSW